DYYCYSTDTSDNYGLF
nr:immunoglobulin light chain junction region [Macaca mulatta]MOX44496.1 immunoglobulin light chain junction region [Macaca mulatta]MOX46068.1 immunoglobulin light chain junction region [Macaca mulatta]